MPEFYPDAYPLYCELGHTVLPLPEMAKASPPAGFTGHHGTLPDDRQLKTWARQYPRGNTAFRPADGLIGFDVDTYTSGDKKKDGRKEWDDLCARLGTPPPTWTSTARDPGLSGIKWYRTPTGLKWPGKLGSAIEVVQHVHRYAVVWPSLHPELQKPYLWYNPYGTSYDLPPRLEDFPALPDTWIAHLTSGAVYEAPEARDVSLDDVDQWVEERPIGDPCREMQAQLDRSVDAILNKGAYESARDGVWALLNLAADGHSGVTPALEKIAHTYVNEAASRDSDGREPVKEWQRMLSGAVSKLSTRDTSVHCWCNWRNAPAPVAVKSAPNQYKTSTGRIATLTRLSDIRMKRARWMWDKRIAMGSLSLVAGQPSMGKSTFVYWMVAALTNGTLFGEFEGQAKDVILCCTEDDYEATIKPRLIAAGANTDRIYRIDIVSANDVAEGLNLVEDLGVIKAASDDLDLGLVVFDPLMSRLGGKDSHKDSEVREALEPLTDLARTCGFCVLGLIHFNKSGRSDPMSLLMGSAAFGAVARSVHVVMADPEDDTGARRLLGTVKNNLGPVSGSGDHDLSTFAFTISSVELETEEEEDRGGIIVTSRLKWEEASGLTIRDALESSAGAATGGAGGQKQTKQDAAAQWLKKLFEKHDRPLTKAEVMKSARDDMLSDHNEANLMRAMKRSEFKVERKRDRENNITIAVWGLAEQADGW